MSKAYQVVRDLEAALCEYTGAPYVVTTNSCTMALLLAVAWHLKDAEFQGWDKSGSLRGTIEKINIPSRTYIGVAKSIIHAGGWPTFRNEEWLGAYQLKPLPVWDCARWFTTSLYNMVGKRTGDQCGSGMLCVSFHASKTLGDTQGGAILHDNAEADAWLRRARFDGRTEGVVPKDDTFTQIGWHCYLSPDVAARLLLKLHSLPRHNDPLPNDEYPDLSTMDIFR